MPSDRSFTDYIKTRFYNDIYSAVDGFVEQSWEGFDLRISNVHIIGADTRGRFNIIIFHCIFQRVGATVAPIHINSIKGW
jgi:hypothetical protein